MITLVPGPTQLEIFGLSKHPADYPNQAIKKEMSFKQKGYIFMTRWAKGAKDGASDVAKGRPPRKGWDGTIDLMLRRKTGPDVVPIGLQQRFERVLREHLQPYAYGPDNRPRYAWSEFDPRLTAPDYQPFPFQDEAVRYILHYKRGVLWIPTRVGKTVIAIETYRRTMLAPFFFLVWSVPAIKQTVEAFKRVLPGVSIGVVGDGRCETGAQVIVATVQTLAAAHGIKFEKNEQPKQEGPPEIEVEPVHYGVIREIFRNAQAVVWDECHHCAGRVSQSLSKLLISAEIVIGLSATPWREDNRDLVIEAVCGPVIYRMSVSEAVALGRQVPLEVMIFDMPDQGLVVPKGAYRKAYVESLITNDTFHELVRSVVQWLRATGHTVGVIVAELPHGKRLEALIPGGKFIHGKSDDCDKDTAFKLVNERADFVLISTLINEAMDLPGLSAVVIADVKSSGTLVVQRATRASTAVPGKTKAVVAMFQFPVDYLEAHGTRAANFLRSEPAYRVARRQVYADGRIGKIEHLSCVRRPGGGSPVELHPGARTPAFGDTSGAAGEGSGAVGSESRGAAAAPASARGQLRSRRHELGPQGHLPLLPRTDSGSGR